MTTTGGVVGAGAGVGAAAAGGATGAGSTGAGAAGGAAGAGAAGVAGIGATGAGAAMTGAGVWFAGVAARGTATGGADAPGTGATGTSAAAGTAKGSITGGMAPASVVGGTGPIGVSDTVATVAVAVGTSDATPTTDPLAASAGRCATAIAVVSPRTDEAVRPVTMIRAPVATWGRRPREGAIDVGGAGGAAVTSSATGGWPRRARIAANRSAWSESVIALHFALVVMMSVVAVVVAGLIFTPGLIFIGLIVIALNLISLIVVVDRRGRRGRRSLWSCQRWCRIGEGDCNDCRWLVGGRRGLMSGCLDLDGFEGGGWGRSGARKHGGGCRFYDVEVAGRINDCGAGECCHADDHCAGGGADEEEASLRGDHEVIPSVVPANDLDESDTPGKRRWFGHRWINCAAPQLSRPTPRTCCASVHPRDRRGRW